MPAKTRSKPTKSTTPGKTSGKTSGKSPDLAAQGSGRASREPGPPSEEEIRQRAYEIYLERGADDGHHVDDWEEARRELMSRRVRL